MENAKVIIKLTHEEPVDLMELSTGLYGLGKMYERHNKDNESAKLEISEIRKSCIEIDIISTFVGSAIPLLNNTNNLIQFANDLKAIYNLLKTKNINGHSSSPSIRDIKDFRGFLGLVKAKGNKLSVGTVEGKNNKVHVHFHLGNTDYPTMKKNYNELISEPLEEQIKEKQLFYWDQINFSKETSHKGQIDCICDKALPVKFSRKEIKMQMTHSNSDCEWQDMCYSVDIEIQYIKGVPRAYKILENYPDESFPRDE